MWHTRKDNQGPGSSTTDQTYQDFVRQVEGADALHLRNWSRTDSPKTLRSSLQDFRFPWTDSHVEHEQPPKPELGRQASSGDSTRAAIARSEDNLLGGSLPRVVDTSYFPLDIDINQHRLRSHSKYGKSFGTARYNPSTAILLFLALGFGTLTGVFASGSARKMLQARFFSHSPSNSLLTLRILSEVSTLLLWALYLGVLEEFQWALASRGRGVNVLQHVALDMGTGLWGLLRLAFRIPARYKASVVARLILLLCVPIPGILIMSDISINEIFFSIDNHPVSAGLAKYNSTLSMSLDTKWATALCVSVGNPVWNARNSFLIPPVPKDHGGCISATAPGIVAVPCEEAYFMSGGIEMVAPQLDEKSASSSATAIVVPNTQGYHIEFGAVRDLQSLLQAACAPRGDDAGAIYWCLSKGKSDEFLLGGVYCPLEIQKAHGCLNDTSWTRTLTLSTSVYIYRRSATVYYYRSNFTILRVTDMSPPIRVNLSSIDVFLGLNAVSVSANNCSAISHYAATILPASDNQNAALLAIRETRAVFGLILHYFHANFVGALDSVWILDRPRPGLEAEMYTTASFATPAYQATASRDSLWLFVGFQGTILLIFVMSILQSRRNIGNWPVRTGYSALDFAVSCLPRGDVAEVTATMRLSPSRDLPNALNDTRVWAGPSQASA